MDPEIAAMLEARREPCIWFGHVGAPGSNNRLGGLPALPPGVDWPLHLKTKAPLHFLLQVDLAELPPTPMPGCPFQATLPRSGMLYFFADIDEEMTFDDDIVRADGLPDPARVVFAPSPGPERAAPADLPMFKHAPRKVGGEFAKDAGILPAKPLQAFLVDSFWGDDENGFSVFENGEDYDARMRSIAAATGKDPAEDIPGGPQMFGAETRMYVGDCPTRPLDQILLLEFWISLIDDGDGTAGVLQFWITPENLRTRRFEKTFVISQFD